MEFSIILLLTSFIAGVLTVFAPCIFTFLPVVLGASSTRRNFKKPLIIIVSLGASVFVFSLVLKASTLLIQIPSSFWDIVAGIIILIQGIFLLFPGLWDKLSTRIGLNKSSQILNKTNKLNNFFGDILTGAALGPIFSSCSPTYGFIIGALLQATFSTAIIYLVTYIIGVCLMLLLISILGQKLITKLKWGINPHGFFKKFIAMVFIVIGILIFTGLYKKLEAYIIENLPFLDATQIDRTILENSINSL